MTIPTKDKINWKETDEVELKWLVQEELDIFSRKILESANLSKKEKKEVLKSRETFSSFINSTLNQAKKDIFDKNEILELILNYKPDILENHFKIRKILEIKLQKDFNKNKNLAFLVLKNYIKNWESLENINNFINKISLDNELTKNLLEEKFSDLLEQYWKISRRNTQKYFYNIKNEEIINLILKSKIVDKSWNINQNTIKQLNKEVTENLSVEELNNSENIFNFLLKKLNISPELLDENIKNLLNSIIDLFKINKKIEENSEEKNLDNKKRDKEKTDHTQVVHTTEDEFNENSSLLDFCYPWCILSEFWNNYEIDLWQNNKVEISKQDFNNFNEKSLENYINFLKILDQTKLSFLFENKYKSWFLQLLKNKLDWFDYRTWEWFSEFKTLQTLNLIWNLIWIPKSYYSEEWELWKFDWIITSINIFNEINSTWNINKEKIWTPWNFIWPTIVEKRILQLWILWDNWGFNTEKASEILKKWKLSD